MGEQDTRCFAQRYELDIQVDDYLNAKVWRAYDPKLKIPVTLLLIPSDDPRAEHLIESCHEAEELESPNVVAIKNVIPHEYLAGLDTVSDDQSFVGIVSEEATGDNLTEILARNNEPFSVAEALQYAADLANVLKSAHSQGITHGQLRTSDVIISELHQVRVTGFGITESLVLRNYDADVFDDIRDFGLVVFELLTRVRPFIDSSASEVEEDLRPSLLRREIQSDIDEFFTRTQNGTYASMSQIIADLDLLTDRYKDFEPVVEQHILVTNANLIGFYITKTKLRAATVCLLLLYAFGAVGWQLMTSTSGARGVPSAVLPSDFAGPPLSFANNGFPVASSKYFYPSTISDYDPLGDGQENPDLAQFAIDGNLKSSWRTVNYQKIDLGGKAGVGLLVDLGKSLKPDALFLHFLARGHDAKVFLSKKQTIEVKYAKPFGRVTSSARLKIFTNVQEQSGRYLLIWLTKLPKGTNGNFVGGITEIQVRL